PYGWSPPNYWWDNTHRSGAQTSDLTSQGGSWGMDTEQGPGHTMPTYDSLQRFLSASDQARIRDCVTTNSACYQYHNDRSSNYRELSKESTAIGNRYGGWNGDQSSSVVAQCTTPACTPSATPTPVSDVVEKWQVMNYEVHRSQFEAFIGHSKVQYPLSPST